MEPLNRLLFGERDRSKSARVQAFADALAKTTIDWTWSEDILQDMWEKFTFLAALAATTCVFRGNIAEIMAHPEGKAIATRCFEANVAIARAEGHPPREGILKWAAERLTRPARRAPRCCATWRPASPWRRTTSSGTCSRSRGTWHRRHGACHGPYALEDL